MTYAKQDHRQEDDVACAGCGFVNVFDTSGNFLRRLISNGELNAPWGLALVEEQLWVGNFGDGRINNYDPVSGNFIETLMRADGKRRSNLMACGIFFRSVTAFISPPG